MPAPARRISVLEHGSPAGRFTFAELAPHRALRSLVRQIWWVCGHTAYARERLLPDGDVVLLFNLGSPQGLVARDNPQAVTWFCDAWVSGLQQRYLLLETLGESHLLGVRLDPLGAYALLGLPMSELTDRVVDLDLILGASIRAWHGKLAGACSPDEALARVENLLLERLGHARPRHPAVAFARRRLVTAGGEGALADLCRETGLSAKSLGRHFTAQVGVPPKRFARLLRFRRAVTLLNQPARQDLATVALECGYFDQPHFNREFRHFAGVSPTVYLSGRGPDGTTVIEG